MKPMRSLVPVATFALMILASAVARAQSEDAPVCYDAIVHARIVAQVPSGFPDCGPDCIVMTWPWFLDLDVKRSEIGNVPRGRLETLVMLHTYLARSSRPHRWWLRRNTLGGYNVLRFGEHDSPERCKPDSAAAKPYLAPGPNETLNDLREEGKRRYGAHG